MKEIYKKTQFVRLNGEKEWHNIDSWLYVNYGEIPQNTKKVITDFEEARQVFWADETFFSHKPILTIDYYNGVYPIHLKEKQFDKIEIKIEYIPYSTTIKSLSKILSAEEFLDYLKDHNLIKF